MLAIWRRMSSGVFFVFIDEKIYENISFATKMARISEIWKIFVLHP